MFKKWLGTHYDHTGQETDTHSAAQRLVMALDEVRSLRSRIAELEAQRDTAQQDAQRGREIVADWLAMRIFGKPIYGSGAPQLAEEAPEPEQLESMSRRGRTARDLAREMERKFLEEYQKRTEGSAVGANG